MADNLDALNKKFEELLKTLDGLGAGSSRLSSFNNAFETAGKDSEKLKNLIEDMSDAAEVLGTRFQASTSSLKDLGQMLEDQIAPLTNANKLIGRQTTMFNNVASIQRDLVTDQSGLVDLNKRDIAGKIRKLELLQQEFKFQASLADIAIKANKAEIRAESKKPAPDNKKLKKLYEEQAELKKIAEYNTKEDVAVQGTIGKLQNRLNLESNISKAVGVTGALVEGTGAFMERLGMRSGIFHDAMEASAKAMRDQAKSLASQVQQREENIKQIKELEAKGKEMTADEKATVESLKEQNKLLKEKVTFQDKFNIALEGAGILGKGFGAALRDPAVLVAAIGKGFSELNKAGVEFGQTTGMAADAMSGVHTEVSTAVDMLKTATSVTKELGLNAAAVFTPQQIGQISDMATLLGLSEQAAGRLGLMMKTSGQSADQLGESVYETVKGLNEAGRSAVAPRQVLDDVLTASEDIALSLGNNPDKLAAAATAARKFGMTLSQVDNIANSLLDFESSIEAELEAQLLTGKSINMAKARELALNNDLAGLAKELEKQGVSAVEFSKMNRIQQEATAKALGMSRQELSKSLLTQEAQANMTDEQLAAARGVSLEESKRIGIQERIEKAIQKVQLAFAPVLEALVPIVENALALINPLITVVGVFGKFLATVIKLKPVMFALQVALAAIAAKAVLNNIGAIGTKFGEIYTNIKDVGKSAKSAASAVLGLFEKGGIDKARESLREYGKTFTDAFKGASGAKDKVGEITKDAQGRFRDAKGRFAKNPMAKTMDKGAEATGKMQKKTKGATGAKGPGGFLKSLGDGLAAIGKKFGQVVKGALALGIAGIAIGGSFALALQMVKNVDPVQMIAFSTSIGIFGGALALLGNMASQVIKGSVAMGILSLAAIGFATAFSMLENVDTDKMIAFSIAVPLLGLAAAGLGFLAGFIIAGAAAIGVLGLSLIPLAGAFALLGAVNIQGVLGSLSQFAAMTPGLLLAGPALLGLSAGLISLGGAAVFGIAGLGMLGAISMMGPGLALAGSGVTALAEGVARLSAAMNSLETEKLKEVKDLIMTTAFAAPAVAATGAITSLIQGIAGSGGGSDDPVAAKIQELIDLVASGQIVELKLDSDTISRQQMISLSKGK